jgi:phosphatidylglycerol:prolipoprotein diacylglycerol transferase
MHTEVFRDFPHYLTSSVGNIWGGLLLGGALAYWKYYEKKKEQLPEPKLVEKDYLPEERVGTLLLLAAIFGYIGAKLFAYLENPGDFIEFISEPFNGLTMYGGLICALLAGFVYFRKNKLPTMHFLDALAPALILAYGIGRIGCHVAGDGDWGIVNLNPNPGLPDWLWAYDYPNNVNADGIPMENCIYGDKFCNHLPQPVYPTPLYESIMCTLIFGILWFMRKRIKPMGVMFFTYLTFNGVERFLIEQIRVNEKYHFMGINITQAELIALAFILAGLAGIFYFYRKYKKDKIPQQPITG